MPSPLFTITPLNAQLGAELARKIDQKTKPLGALGRLETLALQLGRIQNSLTPNVTRPALFVFAGDHGAAKAGISAYPQDVTWQMVENFLAGGAAINVFARQTGWDLKIVDAGVAHVFGPREGLIDAKLAHGTANYLEEAAMSDEQCRIAVARGAALVREAAENGSNVLACGEMGIGNTAAASLLTHFLTNVPLDRVIGRGTGLDDEGLQRKKTLLAQAVARYQKTHANAQATDATDTTPNDSAEPMRILAEFGGFEIAMMVGALLAAAEAKMLIVADGFIVTSALLVAARLHPAIIDYCVFAHRSGEPGHAYQIDSLGGTALLDLGLRLGEGTGAALALPIIQAAANFLNEMASFDSAGVTEAKTDSTSEATPDATSEAASVASSEAGSA